MSNPIRPVVVLALLIAGLTACSPRTSDENPCQARPCISTILEVSP